MNRLYLILFCLMVVFAGCNGEIDDIKKRQDEMEKRLADLEAWRESTNAQLVVVNGLVGAMQQNKLIKELKPFPDGSGYKIIFEDGEEMIIKHGTDGNNGIHGKDGTAPVVGVELDEATGKYYWTQKVGDAAPERVKDVWGQDVEVSGGAKGEDGKTPQLGVDADGYWVMIIDGVPTRVTDASNLPVKALPSGDSVIWKVEEDADKVTFYLMSGDTIVINKSAAAPATVVAVLAVPDFTASYVYNIMLDGAKVGEICREYNPAISTTEAIVVVYPYKADGKVYGKGMVMKDGGSIKHDGTEYAAGTTPATTITVKSNGGVSITADAVSGDASICVADKLKDVENNEYKIVKIGAKYWMAENLKTLKYNDGVALLTNQTQADMAKGASTTVDACVVQGSLDANASAQAGNKAKFGLLYNGVSVKKDNGKLAPTGWHVATLADWNALKNQIVPGDPDYSNKDSKNVATNGVLKSSATAADGGWTTVGANQTGFSALTGGIWDTSFKPTEHRWWTGTTYEDGANNKLCSFVIYDANVTGGAEGTGDLRKQYDNHGRCFAVRCVRD